MKLDKELVTEVVQLVDDLEAHGVTGADAIEAAARWLMVLIDWREVIPGPVGALLEANDERAIAFVKVLIRFAKKKKK